MRYAAKCYWPGVTDAALEQVAGRATRAGLDTGAGPVSYLGSLLFAAGGLVLCHGPDMRPAQADCADVPFPRFY
jgi:hypothetical protein